MPGPLGGGVFGVPFSRSLSRFSRSPTPSSSAPPPTSPRPRRRGGRAGSCRASRGGGGGASEPGPLFRVRAEADVVGDGARELRNGQTQPGRFGLGVAVGDDPRVRGV